METQENLLEDILIEDELVNATTGQRFANLLLDAIGIKIFTFVGGTLLSIPLTLVDQYNSDSTEWTAIRIVLLIVEILFPNLLYYTLFEKLTNGRTLGKLITRTRAVRNDGAPLTFNNAFLRSLCRFVPFDGISLLFNGAPWHDDWTNTRVVKID